MPDLSDLDPFHSGQVKNFYLLVLGQVWTKLTQFCISFPINYYELTMPCFMENSVDPDQLASSEASWSGSTLFSIEFIKWKLLTATFFITAKFFTTSIVFAQMYQFSLNLNSLQQKFSLTSNYLGTNSVVVKRVDCIWFHMEFEKSYAWYQQSKG